MKYHGGVDYDEDYSEFEFDCRYVGSDVNEKFGQAVKVIDEKRKLFEIDVDEIDFVPGKKAQISLRGIYKNKKDVEELKNGIEKAFS